MENIWPNTGAGDTYTEVMVRLVALQKIPDPLVHVVSCEEEIGTSCPPPPCINYGLCRDIATGTKHYSGHTATRRLVSGMKKQSKRRTEGSLNLVVGGLWSS